MDDAAVIGIDIGTTATKVAAYQVDGTALATAERGYPLHSPHPGWAEQDSDEIVAAVFDAVTEVAAAVPGEVAAIGLSAAMHSLIGLDGADHPLTPMLTYADTRAWPQALRLRSEHGSALYRATGTPIHPMAPLSKLAWFREERPDLAARVHRWVSIKEYLLRRLCGSDMVDHAIASATGLFDLAGRDWHEPALEAAGVRAEQLGRLVPTTTVAGELHGGVATRLGLKGPARVIVGASDGVLANLGVGAVREGVAALSIGTSGAIRVTVGTPATDPRMRTFCYVLDEERWVIGGATSNGGLVLHWVVEDVLGADDYAGAIAAAAAVPPGADGVLMLPYLTGERAPRWTPLRGGVLFGLRVEHHRGHIVRAVLEGVALQLRLVADAVRDAGARFDRLRVTGGFVESELWLQIVADVLGTELEVPRTGEAVAYGAAVLAMRAVGLRDSITDVAVAIDHTVTPDADAVRRYDDVVVQYADLVDRLEPLLRDHTLTGTTAPAG